MLLFRKLTRVSGFTRVFRDWRGYMFSTATGVTHRIVAMDVRRLGRPYLPPPKMLESM
jgi:hypothetical protein